MLCMHAIDQLTWDCNDAFSIKFLSYIIIKRFLTVPQVQFDLYYIKKLMSTELNL